MPLRLSPRLRSITPQPRCVSKDARSLCSKRREEADGAAVERVAGCVAAHDADAPVGVDQARPLRDDRAVRKGAAEAEQRDVTGQWSGPLGRVPDLAGVADEAFEIALGVAVQVPVRRAERRIDMADDSG